MCDDMYISLAKACEFSAEDITDSPEKNLIASVILQAVRDVLKKSRSNVSSRGGEYMRNLYSAYNFLKRDSLLFKKYAGLVGIDTESLINGLERNKRYLANVQKLRDAGRM